MLLYRIVKEMSRTSDLSGTGAFRMGGRWNSKGTYMLYTSENSSLALLEMLVHFEPNDFPPRLFAIELFVDDGAPVLKLSDRDYPKNWLQPGSSACRKIGDAFVAEGRYLALRVRSAANQLGDNLLLNPLFPRFHELVRVRHVFPMTVDGRLLRK